MSRDIPDARTPLCGFGRLSCRGRRSSGLVVAGEVDVELAQEFTGGGVDDAHVVVWRRGCAIGVVSASGTLGLSLTPVLLERLVAVTDGRTVRAGEGLVVWVVVVPCCRCWSWSRRSS